MKRTVFIKLMKIIANVYPTYLFVTLLDLIFDLSQTILLSYCLTILAFSFEQQSVHTLLNYLGLFLVIRLLKNLFQYKRSICKEKLSSKIDEALMVHSTKIPYSYLESPDFLNMSFKSKMALKEEDCINTVMDALFNMLKVSISIVIYSVILFRANLWIFLVMLPCFMVNYFSYKNRNKNEQWFYQENIDINRKYNYYTSVLTDIRYAKDFKNTSIGELLFDKYAQFTDRMVQIYEKYLNRDVVIKVGKIVYDSVQKLIVFILIILQSRTSSAPLFSMAYIFDTTVGLSLQISDFFQTINSFWIGIDLVSSVIHIFDIEEESVSRNKSCKSFDELSFSNLSFRYPNSSHDVLKDISLQIKKGEKVCIIGQNGSGKSTIIKLLARLYEIQEGSIKINQVDLKEMNDSDYNQIFSFCFQDSQLLPITIKDNLMSADSSKRWNLYQKFGMEQVIKNGPNGEDSYLNSSINKNGIDISGGEKRKLLIMRCLLKQSNIMVLDEPSAALDIHSEMEMYRLINKEYQDMTVIYVTHNMYAASYADRIIEMCEGRIARIDTFDNLKKDPSSLLSKLYNQQLELFEISN